NVTRLQRRLPMCYATPWVVKGASITLALCLLFPDRTSLAEDHAWEKALSEGRQLLQEGRYAKAEKVLLLAVAEAETFGPENRRLPFSLNELAAWYHATGRLSEAEPLYRRALTIWEKMSEHQEVAILLNNLAGLCLDRGRYEEVQQLSKRALAIAQDLAPQ